MKNKGTPFFSADQLSNDDDSCKFCTGCSILKTFITLVVLIGFGFILSFLVKSGLSQEEFDPYAMNNSLTDYKGEAESVK